MLPFRGILLPLVLCPCRVLVCHLALLAVLCPCQEAAGALQPLPVLRAPCQQLPGASPECSDPLAPWQVGDVVRAAGPGSAEELGHQGLFLEDFLPQFPHPHHVGNELPQGNGDKSGVAFTSELFAPGRAEKFIFV